MSNNLQGFLLLHKPAGITSFSCIYQLRRLIGREYKVGHTGTLDAFASGLLIIAISRTATRHIDLFLKLDKKYSACAQLGLLTDSLDYMGATLSSTELPAFTYEQLNTAVQSFGNGYVQIPPVFSALKYEGERISTLARSGTASQQELDAIVHKKQRFIALYSLVLAEYNHPFFTITAHVSHGTYIRSLMDDIAQKLDTHATTMQLERTAIGLFELADAVKLADLVSAECVERRLIQVDDMLRRLEQPQLT